MHFSVDPGLYALGTPGETSPVLVTANYKMSFDRLREALPGLDAWILVLDTRGVNVWCAAGKGTFGTDELVSRIQSSGLEKVVTHRAVIVPQLGGPGIAAHAVRKRSGFKVIYGPIEARDLPAFIEAGMKATPRMRLKTFTLAERAALVPIELVDALKKACLILPILLLICGATGTDSFWSNVAGPGRSATLGILTAIVGGAILTPLFLPWLPGRSFAWKGLTMGVAAAMVLQVLAGPSPGTPSRLTEAVAWFLLVPALSSYLAMNFTGASTFTSLSGVQHEMRRAVPVQIALTALGTCLWLAARFID